jgi:hypothetical protein
MLAHKTHIIFYFYFKNTVYLTITQLWDLISFHLIICVNSNMNWLSHNVFFCQVFFILTLWFLEKGIVVAQSSAHLTNKLSYKRLDSGSLEIRPLVKLINHLSSMTWFTMFFIHMGRDDKHIPIRR